MNKMYFGNALDLLKFDLLTYLSQESGEHLFYVPMITKPRPKEYDLKYTTYEIGRRNEQLYTFLLSKYEEAESSEISTIGEYFSSTGIQYNILSNSLIFKYFSDEDRKKYFDHVLNEYKLLKKPTLVYMDPDVGSDVGVVRRFRSKKEMYIKGEDLLRVYNELKSGDYIGYFQHLGNSNYSISSRIKDLKEYFGKWVIICGYSRIQASITFLFKDEADYEDKRERIRLYFKQYEFLESKNKIIIE